MSRRVLLIAFHFPPMVGSSGIQRTLGFARHLAEFGWQPLVLSVHPRAHPQIDWSNDWRLPPDLIVEHAFALDTARHLSVFGRYPLSLALPDRWASWQLGAIPAGLAMIRRYRPAAIWSTYPIATAHLIGAALQKRSGLPWIADFRDPMAHDGYPADARTWQAFRRVEDKVFAAAQLATFTTEGAQRLYQARYPQAAERCHVISNGYDEEAFAGLHAAPSADAHIHLLHSGVVYPQWRDPANLFIALRRLRESGHPLAARLRLRFRAASHEDFIRQRAAQQHVSDCVELLPAIPYREALAEMLGADALLVLQSAGCNDQVPAKSYEYLRAGRPLLVLADPASDTARLFAPSPLAHCAALESTDAIYAAFLALLQQLEAPGQIAADMTWVSRFSRRAQAGQLAEKLSQISAR